MPEVKVTDIRMDANGREGLRFTALRKGVTHEFLISREALSDLVNGNPATEVELKAAFQSQRVRIEQKVRTVLDYQYRAPQNSWISLKSSDFQ